MSNSSKPAKKKGKCETKFCRRKAANGKLCNTCSSRKWRAENPMRDCFNNLKQNSKRRGIPFDLTFEDFKELAFKTDYIKGRGRTKDCWSIDRINDDPAKGYWGYRRDNIRVISVGHNSQKRHGKIILDYSWDGEKMAARINKRINRGDEVDMLF